MDVNQERIEKFRGVWSNLRVPVRPGPEGLALYRARMESLEGGHVLVLGATPELVDMAIDIGAARIVSIERDPAILAAMRRLGERDWGRVELIEGDWLDERPDFVGAFDCVVCDGGLLFLAFPGQWRTLFRRVHAYLKPEGVFIAKEWAEPEGRRNYQDIVGALLAAFSVAAQGQSRAERLEAYRFLVSELRLATYVGATLADKSFDQGLMVGRLDPLLDTLTKAYPDPEMVAIAEAAMKFLARSRGFATDTVAGARYGEAAGLLAEQGFRSEPYPLPDRPVAGANYMFVARKRGTGE